MPSASMPSPSSKLQERFWNVLLTEVGPLEIHPGCEGYLRQLVEFGAAQLHASSRLSEDDLEAADANLRRFIELMKEQAVALGHPGSLGEDTFEQAGRSLDAAKLALFPFWPPPFRWW